jgi:vitamin B12 transporter
VRTPSRRARARSKSSETTHSSSPISSSSPRRATTRTSASPWTLANTAGSGDFDGDRIPNRPYVFANGSARLRFRDLVALRDEVALTRMSRYVHEYFRDWESIGDREFKQTIDLQLVHTVGLGYEVKNDDATVSSTVEVQNVTDEAVVDFFGVQRPGWAFYIKTTAEF